MKKITIFNTNQEKPNTCGGCKHTDNDLGIVALHCDLLLKEEEKEYKTNKNIIADGKVRSWYKCQFKPSKYEAKKITKSLRRGV